MLTVAIQSSTTCEPKQANSLIKMEANSKIDASLKLVYQAANHELRMCLNEKKKPFKCVDLLFYIESDVLF